MAAAKEKGVPPTIEFDETLLDTHLLVDVRTPLEYQEDHLPGAINLPLLDNDERVEIGTLYKQTGPHAARIRGLELTAHRFPELVRRIAEAAAGRPIVVYCWRGGLRSKTVASILELTGYPVRQLVGGYKAFRNRVSAFFEPYTPAVPLVVLHGMTGTGKTTFLLQLKDKGFSVIDLEGLACHRGSAFGQLGLVQDLTQKRFETLLWDALRKAPQGVPLVVEGESQRIGRVSLPGNFYETMQQGVKIWCHASSQTRVARLIEEYALPEYRDEMGQALERIRKKLGGVHYEELAGNLERWEMEPFMQGLIDNYYDKVYYKTRSWTEDHRLSLEDYERAAEELHGFLKAQRQTQ